MRTFLATLLAAFGCITVYGQSPPFRSGTALVPILATVTDAHDRLVPGLTVENFEVLDNGRPQHDRAV